MTFVISNFVIDEGPDWKWEEQDGGVGSIGTVYKAMDDATVYVIDIFFVDADTIILTLTHSVCV